MKVKQLIKILQKVDPERFIVMAKDGEGNGYSPLYDICECAYAPDSTWSGEVGLEKLTKADIKAGYSEEDVLKGKKSICLRPVN